MLSGLVILVVLLQFLVLYLLRRVSQRIEQLQERNRAISTGIEERLMKPLKDIKKVLSMVDEDEA